jgi:hypothetical protein
MSREKTIEELVNEHANNFGAPEIMWLSPYDYHSLLVYEGKKTPKQAFEIIMAMYKEQSDEEPTHFINWYREKYDQSSI